MTKLNKITLSNPWILIVLIWNSFHLQNIVSSSHQHSRGVLYPTRTRPEPDPNPTRPESRVRSVSVWLCRVGSGSAKMTSHFCNDVKFLNYGSLKRHLLHFEGTLEQNIKVLNVIFLQRTSSFWTIISVQMKLDFDFEFYFNKVWENIDAVVL